jgi:hypothetical protein
LLTQSFKGQKKECPVLDDRAAAVETELVALEWRRLRRSLEEIAGVERVVAKELESGPVERVGARSGCDVDDRARVPAVLRVEQGVVNPELLYSAERRLKCQDVV